MIHIRMSRRGVEGKVLGPFRWLQLQDDALLDDHQNELAFVEMDYGLMDKQGIVWDRILIWSPLDDATLERQERASEVTK